MLEQKIDKADHPWRDKQILEELYRERGLTIVECAERLECGKSTIGNWLERHEIPRWTGAERRTRCKIEVTERHHEILTGLLMSDATLSRGKWSPAFTVRMVEPEFLDWLDTQLGQISRGVSLYMDAEERAKTHRETGFNPNADPNNYQDLYRLDTRALPDFEPYGKWYGEDGKVWPPHIDLTPVTLKMFYCGDGNMKIDRRESNRRPYIRFRADNESDNKQKVIQMFKNAGFEVSWPGDDILVSADESERMWDYMGSPPPGFDYKWPSGGEKE